MKDDKEIKRVRKSGKISHLYVLPEDLKSHRQLNKK